MDHLPYLHKKMHHATNILQHLSNAPYSCRSTDLIVYLDFEFQRQFVLLYISHLSTIKDRLRTLIFYLTSIYEFYLTKRYISAAASKKAPTPKGAVEF